MANKIQLRRDTTANWARVNPILDDGEPGLDITTNQVKYGDGANAWVDLSYASGGGGGDSIVNGNYSVSVGANGVVTMETSRGSLEFGALPEPGGPSHFHIMRASGDNADLYFGDDFNYVLQPGPASGPGHPPYGVEIGTKDIVAGSQNVWRFGTDGNLTFPNGDLTIGSDTYGAPAIMAAAGKNISMLASGVGDGYEIGSSLIWVDSITEPTKIAGVTANNPLFAGAGDVGIVTGDYFYTGTTNVWNFGADGSLTLPTGGEIKTAAGTGSVAIEANDGNNTRTWTFGTNGSLTFPDTTTQSTAYKRTTGSWTVATGSGTYSFTVPLNGTYTMWVRGNIPDGIVVWNATATVTNNNVPVIGQQFAWNYTGAGTPIEITAMPTQFVGTVNTIVSSNPSVGSNSNVFNFTINNTSGSAKTVYWGYVTQ